MIKIVPAEMQKLPVNHDIICRSIYFFLLIEISSFSSTILLFSKTAN